MRTALRDRAAFDQLYDATSAKLFGVCLRILQDRAEAEDALQDVFVKIWTRAERFAVSDLSPISWLVAIARNHAIDILRSRKPATNGLDAVDNVADGNPDPESQAISASNMAEIDRCLKELGQNKAAAVRGAYIDGDSYAELAMRHDVPLNTIRTWLRRSLINLRNCLER